MRKSLLSISLLAGLFSAVAQKPTIHMDDKSKVWVGESALVFNGGGLQTKDSGLFDIHGNVMIVGKNTDKFRTIKTSGSSQVDKVEADISGNNVNIVLRLNKPDEYDESTYGQLYVTGIPQDNMPAYVTKEYRTTKHGVYQQVAMPFYNKTLESLRKELGLSGFSNQRNNPSVMYWDNNGAPQFHDLKSTQHTGGKNRRDIDAIVNNNAARYYIIGTGAGTNTWDPSTQVRKISGQLFSDATEISYDLKNAGYKPDGQPVNYGVGTGSGWNEQFEPFHTYLQDKLDHDSQGFFNQTANAETGTFGRNIYQFGNPFMTNIDLSMVGYDEYDGDGDDKNNLCDIQGIRYEATKVTLLPHDPTNVSANMNVFRQVVFSANADYSGNGQFTNPLQVANIPIGDIDGAIIKPMQAFAIKMRHNRDACTNPSTGNRKLIFNSLRRFAYNPRLHDPDATSGAGAQNPYGVTLERNGNVPATIKQLRVIAFDDNGLEVGRTYFAVAKQFKTGSSSQAYVQVTGDAYSNLYTREELPSGGADVSLPSAQSSMYINEANEIDFEGKKMQLDANLTNVKNYRFELAENAAKFADAQSDFVDGGKSFYIEQTPGQFVKISHNMIIPATAAQSGLYYGLPSTAQLSTGENKWEADSELQVAYEKESATHQVIFPKKWNKATVTIFDMSGRRISINKEVDASKNFVLPALVEGAYIVEVVSDKGIKAVKKIVK